MQHWGKRDGDTHDSGDGYAYRASWRIDDMELHRGRAGFQRRLERGKRRIRNDFGNGNARCADVYHRKQRMFIQQHDGTCDIHNDDTAQHTQFARYRDFHEYHWLSGTLLFFLIIASADYPVSNYRAMVGANSFLLPFGSNAASRGKKLRS